MEISDIKKVLQLNLPVIYKGKPYQLRAYRFWIKNGDLQHTVEIYDERTRTQYTASLDEVDVQNEFKRIIKPNEPT